LMNWSLTYRLGVFVHPTVGVYVFLCVFLQYTATTPWPLPWLLPLSSWICVASEAITPFFCILLELIVFSVKEMKRDEKGHLSICRCACHGVCSTQSQELSRRWLFILGDHTSTKT